MASFFTLIQECGFAEALLLATDAAGRTSPKYATMKHSHKLYLVVHILQGAANTILLSPLQATAVAGTGTKVFPAGKEVAIWTCLDAAANDTFVRQTDAVNFTTDAAVKNKIVVFEIDGAKLDVANSFDCVGLSTGASNVLNLTSALYLSVPSRFGSFPMPSLLVD